MTVPRPARCMWGNAALDSKKGARKFAPSTRSQASAERSVTGPGTSVAALFTKTSSRPRARALLDHRCEGGAVREVHGKHHRADRALALPPPRSASPLRRASRIKSAPARGSARSARRSHAGVPPVTRSITWTSSSDSSGRVDAATFCSTCSGVFPPGMATDTAGWFSTNRKAS